MHLAGTGATIELPGVRGMETGIISGDRPAVEKMSAVMEDVNRICKLEKRMQR
jgi:hypothetical protein